MNIHAKRCLYLCFSGVCMLSAHTWAQDLAANDISKSQLAAEAYEKNHWVDAFTAYAQLAETGNAHAARIAYQMWKYDVQLYSTQFSITPLQLERWRALQSTSLLAVTVRPHRQATAP